MLGINSRLYTDELKEKWKENESEGDDEEEEEMERVESEEEFAEVKKHVNGDEASTRPEGFQVPILRFYPYDQVGNLTFARCLNAK